MVKLQAEPCKTSAKESLSMTIDEKVEFLIQELYPNLMMNSAVRDIVFDHLKTALMKLERREQDEKTQNLNTADTGRYRIDPIS